MKKWVSNLLLGFFLSVIPCFAFATTYSISGYQLDVNCSPFLARGFNYGPTPIGDTNTYYEWCQNLNVCAADFAQMSAMGVNTIRVYFDYANLFNTNGTVNPATLNNYNAAFQLAAQYGIWIVADFWVPYNVDYTVTANRQAVEAQFEDVINLFTNTNTYPNLLMWAFGNENNSSANYAAGSMTDQDMFNFDQEAISDAKTATGDTHPFTVVLVNNGDVSNTTYTGTVTSANVWSVNAYLVNNSQWSSFLAAYNVDKPLFISETGNNAYNGTAEDDTDQNTAIDTCWTNIGADLSALNSSDTLLGACFFEWNDEWWKCTGAGTSNSTQDACGVALNQLPSNVGYQEWFGISTALSLGVSSPRTYRLAATTLKDFWTSSPYNTTIPSVCSGVPTATPTYTPTIIVPSCAVTFSNFSNGLGQSAAAFGSVSWTDYFYPSGSSGGGIGDQAPGEGSTGYSLQFGYGYTVSGDVAELIAPLSASANNSTGAGNIDLSQYGQITFYATAESANTPYTFEIASAGGAGEYGGNNYAWWGAPFTVGTSWAPITITLSAPPFTNPGGNTGTFVQNLQDATQLVIVSSGAPVTGNLWMDDVVFYPNSCMATSTPTNTATSTPTKTATSTATNTFTSTPTSTGTYTPSNTMTSTSTPSATPSATPSSTFSSTATATETMTLTNSPTSTSANTSTNTPTPTITSTPTFTFSPTQSMTFTDSPTITFTDTNTPSPTITSTPTFTFSPTQSMTFTDSPTVTFTGTDTFSPTVTSTSTSTLTDTATDTSTNTPTGTLTPVLTPTGTPTETTTSTFSSTVTLTFTVTASLTPSPTFSSTPSMTMTFSSSPTSMLTATPTFSETFTPTNSPTLTLTNTPTETATFTFTPLSTFSFTPTQSNTATPVMESISGGPYPNPSNGSPINVWINVSQHTLIQWSVFTTAFRKIISNNISLDHSGYIQWNLKDEDGYQVADGLYYLRIQINGINSSTKVFKVLVLR